MSDVKTFGRRQGPKADAVSPAALSPAAEAFRGELAGVAHEPSEQDRFLAFQRQRRGRVIGVWLLRLLFCAPGLLCFVIGAPNWLSLVLEAAGLALGAWIRQERRRQLKEIAAWEPSS